MYKSGVIETYLQTMSIRVCERWDHQTLRNIYTKNYLEK